MNTLLKILQFLIIGIILTGCSDSTGIEDRIELQYEAATKTESPKTRAIKADDLTFEQVKTYLDQYGCDTTTQTEYEDYYLIDSDMGFDKERLAEAMSQPTTRMAYKKLLDKQYPYATVSYSEPDLCGIISRP